MIARVFSFQLNRVKNNKLVFLLLIVLACIIVWFANVHDAGKGHADLIQAVAYLFAMWLCSFCIDIFTLLRPFAGTYVIRRPLIEALITILCPLLGAGAIFLRFLGPNWEHAGGLYKIFIVITFVLFLYPIGLTIIMLAFGYRLKEFGLRLQGFFPSIVVIVITCITAYLAAPGRFTLHQVLQEGGGVLGALLAGFVYAGLSEELFRLLCQTRVGAAVHNNGLGWFFASLLWGLMHGPKWYVDDHNAFETIFSCLRIVPLGLMWGYLTHRTRSILPSILAHGLNVWGLQNF